MLANITIFQLFLLVIIYFPSALCDAFKPDCNSLQIGQYICNDVIIEKHTQQPRGCTRDNKAEVSCRPTDDIVCYNSNSDPITNFTKTVPCKWTNGKDYRTALFLSIFTGWLGIDRFYLGYPAIGLLKLSTFGFLLLGALVDIILIATQVVGPSDGSHYVTDYYGPAPTAFTHDNDTYLIPVTY